MSERYRAVARVIKTHGKRGEVVTQPVDGLPLLLEDGMEVVVVPPRLKGARRRRVLACSSSGSGQLVRLSGVEDLGAAAELVGRELLVEKSQLPEDFTVHDVRSLLGRSVWDDTYGELGVISEVMQGPANDVWCVVGKHGEVLVPVVDEYLESVEGEGAIRTRLPEGFVAWDEGGPVA